ncbi:MAG TPA: type II secretion system F family protein [Pyrinomonadaceae bacterium]|nr:type II secretion system F family protein [Pyrinomonadaceae bacterium]
MLISTSVLLFFLFLTYALFLLASRKSDERQARMDQRVAEALRDTTRSTEEAIQISRDDLMAGNATLNRFLSSLDLAKKLKAMITQADTQITVSRLLGFSFLLGLMGGLAAYTVINGFFATAIFFLAAAVPIFQVSLKRRKRMIKFNSQLPDTLDLLSRSLAVGHAFSEALNQVSTEMPDPIAGEFRIAFEEQKLGLSTKVALDRLTERMPLADLRLCVTAMHIQRETGGNLAEILERVAQTIRERFKLMEDFRTMTTSSRASAWILCGLPFALVFLLTAINPDYMSKLLYDPRGHYVIALAVVLQLIGMLLIRNILKIKI